MKDVQKVDPKERGNQKVWQITTGLFCEFICETNWVLVEQSGTYKVFELNAH